MMATSGCNGSLPCFHWTREMEEGWQLSKTKEQYQGNTEKLISSRNGSPDQHHGNTPRSTNVHHTFHGVEDKVHEVEKNKDGRLFPSIHRTTLASPTTLNILEQNIPHPPWWMVPKPGFVEKFRPCNGSNVGDQIQNILGIKSSDLQKINRPISRFCWLNAGFCCLIGSLFPAYHWFEWKSCIKDTLLNPWKNHVVLRPFSGWWKPPPPWSRSAWSCKVAKPIKSIRKGPILRDSPGVFFHGGYWGCQQPLR